MEVEGDAEDGAGEGDADLVDIGGGEVEGDVAFLCALFEL